MKKLLTKLATVAMVTACLSVPISMDAKTVYFDTQGETYSAMRVHAWNSENTDENTDWNSGGVVCEKVGNYIWKATFDDKYNTAIFCKEKLDDNNKLNGANGSSISDGKLYSSSNTSGIPYQLLIQANAEGVDWNQGKALTQDPSNPSVFTGEIEMSGDANFRFAHAPNGDNYSKFSVYAPSSETSVSEGSTTTLAQNNSTKQGNWKIPAGKYTVKVDLSANTFTFTSTATSYFENGEVIYFKPSTKWKEANAIFRAVFNDNSTASCTELDKDPGYYCFTVPKEGLTTVKIERGPDSNAWGWNTFTQELKSSNKNENNCIEITNTEYNGAAVRWTVFTPTVPTSYNRTLFVGIASANRHQIQYVDGAYQTYKFYVNQEDMTVDNEFGFRFYSEPNGGVWMGNDTFGQTIQTDTKYTTNGNKRYFIKEAGAYAIDVESYDPEENTVVFTLTKLADDAVVRPELYIGGTWSGNEGNDGAKTRIESSKGKYAEYKFTVTSPNSKFRFFSASNGGTGMGPIYTNNINVDATGALAYTTVGNDNAFNIVETGEYVIKVSDYVADNKKVTFTLTKMSEGTPVDVPSTLYMRNSRDEWKNVQKMTYDSETKTFEVKLNYNADEAFSFHFYENNESDWSARGKVYRPGDNTDNVSIPSNYLALVGKYDGVSKDPYSAWQYKASNAEEITILVHFNKSVPTVEVVAARNNYYFIGDLNNWYSNEFDGETGTDRYGDPIAQGINQRRWNAEKDNWKFEYAGDGWYMFTRFPNQLFSGHFQIVSGGSWNGDANEIYSHMVIVDKDEIEGGKVDNTYKAFKQNRITRDDILNGKEYRVRKRTKIGNDYPGSNLHTQCNAVENAELWFYPGNDLEAPRIKLVGTPKDYFIFYNMTEAIEDESPADMKVSLSGETNSEYWVRARINSGKPNTNNYFMAGIKYGGTTLPFYDINGNTGAHMNLGEGIDLAPYDLKNMSEAELNNLFFKNQDIVKSILNEDRLPNGRDISVYDKVWVAKIPSGFENPAGTKYNMTFNKAMTEADRTSTRTLNTRHYYFFPQEEGLHVHINTDEITDLTNVASVDVAYRLYKTDNYYNTITIHHGEGTRTTEQLHAVGSVLPLTAESASKDKGWNVCEKLSKSNWGDPTVPGYTDDEWYVSWIPATETVPAHRREVAYDDNSAFVQFRMTIHLKQPINAAPGRRNEPISSYTVYVPERVDVANDKHHFSFNNQDLYVKTRAGEGSDGVWTGLREVLDEINGNVDPSSVETVYYNLQGVRVDNPTEGGVYIRVRGDKSDKVLF